jgi:hypothetical protein
MIDNAGSAWRQYLRPRCPSCSATGSGKLQPFCTICGSAFPVTHWSEEPLWLRLSEAERQMRLTRIAEVLASHPSSEVRRQVAGLSVLIGDERGARQILRQDPGLTSIDQLRNSKTLDSAYARAIHPDASNEEIEKLAQLWGSDMSRVVASNPLTPPSVISLIFNAGLTHGRFQAEVNASLASNPATPPSILKTLAAETANTQILSNCAIPENIFFTALAEWVALDNSPIFWPSLRQALANLACPTVLWEMAATSARQEIRNALIDNPSAPDDLKALAHFSG